MRMEVKETSNRAIPFEFMVATVSWWFKTKLRVVAATLTCGHVIVARLMSTTHSARHQEEKRWNMLH